MTHPTPEPPRLSRGLLAAALPRDVREAILGDLSQLFHDRVQTGGITQARAWYRREAREMSIQFGAARLRETAEGAVELGTLTCTGLMEDTAAATRILRRRPLSWLTLVPTLAVGLGVLTVSFAAFDAMFLRPLPGISGGERIVEVGRTEGGRGFDTFSYADLLTLAEGVPEFEALAPVFAGQISVLTTGASERRLAFFVGREYFDVLGAGLQLGRTFTPAEEFGRGGSLAVIITDRMWRDRFDSSPGVVGTSLRVRRTPHTIVGVAPPEFRGHIIGLSPVVFLPIASNSRVRDNARGSPFTARGFRWLLAVARLSPEASLASARISSEKLMAALAEKFPESNGVASARLEVLTPFPRAGRDVTGAFVLMVLALGTLILATTCLNTASTLLSRSVGRTSETAIRLALGAPRSRVSRLVVIEAVLLFLAGGLGGLLLAKWMLHLLGSINLPMPFPIDLSIDAGWWVGVAALGVAVIFGGLAAAWPAWHVGRTDPSRALTGNLSSTRGVFASVRSVFVAVQVASSVTLLLVGVTFAAHTSRSDPSPGFEADGRFMTTLNLSTDGYRESPEALAVVQRILEAVRVLPSVSSASVSADLPMDLIASALKVAPKGWDPEDGRQELVVDVNLVSPDYFRTLGIPRDNGRDFTQEDRADSEPVAIVSQSFVDQVWESESALGRFLEFDGGAGPQRLRVIGVVGDVPNMTLARGSSPLLYLPIIQNYTPGIVVTALQRSGKEEISKSDLRAAITSADAELAMTPVLRLSEYTGMGSLPYRAAAWFSTLLGIFALLLANIGLQAVVSFWVTAEERDQAIRISVGSSPLRELGRTLRRVGAVVWPGLALGIVAAGVIVRRVEEIGALNGAAAAGVLALAVCAIAIAAIVPGRRILSHSPAHLLRQ